MMPTALAEWTTERPEEPGFYWWVNPKGGLPEIVEVERSGDSWVYLVCGMSEWVSMAEAEASGTLWWPIRLEHPPVG